MSMKICVYSSSSKQVSDDFKETALELGRDIGRRGWTLVFGSGQHGLMGATARGVHETGGTVVGVIPEQMHTPQISYMDADEIILTKDLRERKGIMEDMSDGFIALPGGIGTLEEILEVLTLRQLDFLQKPIIFLNTKGYYDPLFKVLDHMIDHKTYTKENKAEFDVSTDPKAALDIIENHSIV